MISNIIAPLYFKIFLLMSLLFPVFLTTDDNLTDIRLN